jgi:miniconductance mechanosensitive channel
LDTRAGLLAAQHEHSGESIGKMNEFFEMVRQWALGMGLAEPLAVFLGRTVLGGTALALSVLAYLVANRILVRWIRTLAGKTRSQWDDALVRRKVFSRLSHLAPALVLYTMADAVLAGMPQAVQSAQVLMKIYMVLVGFWVGSGLLDAVVDIYRTMDISRSYPIRGFVQVVKLVIFLVTAIFVASLILNKSPAVLVGSLGALTAIAMLVFKDSLLGLVAGVHLSANKMLARGDWVELPSHGADGEVLEVTLATVKIQNWDRTITTVPTYALISESFKNWRGMTESGGRRIKRALHIDVNTIRFCDDAMLQRLGRIEHIAAYMRQKQDEVSAFNAKATGDPACVANRRRLTNVGTFRAYIKAYLENHPMINQSMTLIVRQLAPTDRGLPIEIYAFCTDKRWARYEMIMADIFDHIFAIMPEFELRAFQTPGGTDVRSVLTSLGTAPGG